MPETQPDWFAVYTKPRQERIALENLERQGFRCFLPMAINPYQRRSARGPRIEPLDQEPGHVYVIDLRSRDVVATVTGVGNDPYGIAFVER